MPIIRGQSMLIYHLPVPVASASMEIASANIVSVVAGLQLDASKVNPQMTEDDLIASILSATTTSVVNSQLMVAGTGS